MGTVRRLRTLAKLTPCLPLLASPLISQSSLAQTSPPGPIILQVSSPPKNETNAPAKTPSEPAPFFAARKTYTRNTTFQLPVVLGGLDRKNFKD